MFGAKRKQNTKTEKFFKFFSFFVYVLVSGSMLSGANALLSKIFVDFGFPLWSIFLVFVSTFVINFGINGLLKTSFFLVPLIIVGIVCVGVQSSFVSTISSPAFSTDFQSISMLFFGAISYVCFNLITANNVIEECGKKLSKKQIKKVSLIVSLVISLLISLIIIVLLINNESTLFAEMPLVDLGFLVSKFVGLSFSFVLFLSIITTIFSTHFSASNYIGLALKNKKGRKILPSLISSLLILGVSLFGFGEIVKFAYPVVGAVGFIMLFNNCKLSFKSRLNSANNEIHSASKKTKNSSACHDKVEFENSSSINN